MAKLQVLQISGIRNFGPNSEDMARIKFSSPMTLFLGQNGCGKTTIIESLKYACTGDVPMGSNNGQSFIHDPKINGTVINKGQVRLKIIDAKGQELVVVKSAQVKQERDKLKFSTLDSAITIKKVNGEQEQLSSRCTDIGIAFCSMMGISKPILNYVIFCHQEESLWPLDEGKSLKEKFDKIFDIDNYNKCIELMRKMVKEKTSENKILKAHVDRTQILKDVIERDRHDLQNKQTRLERMDNDISAKKDQMKPLYERVQEILNLENNICDLDKQISDKSAGKKLLFEQQKSILKYIEKEFEGTDEELSQAIADFQQNADVDNKKIADLNRRKVSIDDAKTEILKTINKKQVNVGRLKESMQQHENQVTERNDLIKVMSTTLKTKVALDLKDNDNATNAIGTLDETLSKKKVDLDLAIAENEKSEKQLQDVVDKVREKNVQAKQGIDYKQKQILEIKNKVKTIKDQLHDLDVNDGELKGFKTRIANIDKDLQILQSTFNFTQVAANIEKEKKQIQTLETNLEDLESELKVLQKNFNIEYDIDTKKQDILKREGQVKKLKNKHSDNFNVLFNPIPSGGLKTQVDTRKQNAYRTVQNLTATISKKQSECTKYETEIKMHKRKIDELTSKLERSKVKIEEVCGDKDYKEVSQKLNFDIEKLQREKGQANSGRLMYEKFIKNFQEDNPCCPVCSTDFNNKQQAIAKIIKTLKEQISNLPKILQEIEVKLVKAQDLYSKVLQVGSVNDEVEDLSNVQIPIVTDELNTLNEKLELTRSELVSLEDELVQPQKILDACNAVTEDAIIIDQNQIEIQKSKTAIESLTLDLVNVESKKSRQEVEVEMENMKSELSDTRRSHDTQQKKLIQNKTREQNLREDRSKIIDRQLELQKIMQGKPQLEEQLIELKQSEEKLLNEIEELRTQYVQFSNELYEAEQNRNLVKQTNKACAESSRKEYNKYILDFQEIKKIQSKIKDYLRNNVEAQFTKAMAELVQLKSKEVELDESKDNLNEAINELTRLRESKKEEFKKLENNVDLRKLRVSENVAGKELEALEKRRGTYNPKTLSNEKRTLEQRWTALNNEMNTQKGSRNQLNDAINELERKLNLPEHKNAYIEYKKKLLESKISERATDDLKIYAQALEASIMQFHSDRMKQVNRIIRDYWRQIYRGNDIDYIEIKNEIPKDAPANKRVYNYRVVQMKNGTEIDMRGRCSAGQKVLACLIIRLALAETFSNNCGILALDEPTTNLDRENIVSLSEALARIVNARQAEKNFQLLVITHDEEFLETLTQVEKVSFYYKVSRNQNGNSVITRAMLN